MNHSPLVTVICICYNHQHYVIEALESVIHQTYKPIEIIVVDDASQDQSAEVIRVFCNNHPAIKFLEFKTNVGNCKAFNRALGLARGEFIIDLAADDILLPQRVEDGVRALLAKGEDVGVHFTNAEGVDQHGNHLWFHTDKISMKEIPQGDVYKELISHYFVCSPTTMFRRSVMDALGGYDESLAFEDFDFWVRSSRLFKYCYTDKVLMKKRILPKSKSQTQYKWGSPQMRSIFIVCNKIFYMNKSRQEMHALKKRIYYELRQAMLTGNIKLVIDYFMLLKKIRRHVTPGILSIVYPLGLV